MRRLKTALVGGLSIVICGCGVDTNPDGNQPASVQFVEASVQLGIDFVHYNGARGNYYYPETFGSGAAFLDYDGDGWLDIYLVNGRHLSGLAPDDIPLNRLFHSRGAAAFDDVTVSSGVGDATGYGMGCSAADYDNDGDQDLYVTNFGPNTMLRNDGEAGFFDATGQTGVGDSRWGASAGFLDYDLDGDLDLFVANYVDFRLDANPVCRRGLLHTYCEPQNYEPIGDLLYRNDGDRFRDVSAESGITLSGRGLGVALSDYDRDGDTDIYVANDATMNFLYENRDGHFSEVGLYVGGRYNLYGQEEAGMGVDFGDIDNDGWQDLFVTNFARETNTLYHNSGRGSLVDVTDRMQLIEPSVRPLGFGTRFMDYDNDGWLDLFVANGHVLDIISQLDSTDSQPQADQMLRNERGHHFEDVSATLGPALGVKAIGRAAAVADYDNDGDLDLLVNNTAQRPKLLRNDGGNNNNWLLIELIGRQHGDALGTRVTVTTALITQTRERQSGGSYLSSHDPRLHFGLGSAGHVDIEVRWPDGSVDTLREVTANQILRLEQGML